MHKCCLADHFDATAMDAPQEVTLAKFSIIWPKWLLSAKLKKVINTFPL
jgi:hypothetical protein